MLNNLSHLILSPPHPVLPKIPIPFPPVAPLFISTSQTLLTQFPPIHPVSPSSPQFPCAPSLIHRVSPFPSLSLSLTQIDSKRKDPGSGNNIGSPPPLSHFPSPSLPVLYPFLPGSRFQKDRDSAISCHIFFSTHVGSKQTTTGNWLNFITLIVYAQVLVWARLFHYFHFCDCPGESSPEKNYCWWHRATKHFHNNWGYFTVCSCLEMTSAQIAVMHVSITNKSSFQEFLAMTSLTN